MRSHNIRPPLVEPSRGLSDGALIVPLRPLARSANETAQRFLSRVLRASLTVANRLGRIPIKAAGGGLMLICLSVGAFLSAVGCGEESPRAEPRTADVVYVATPHDVVAKMLEVAQVTKTDVLYDLGCGDGRVVATAARATGCRGWGFDISPERVAESLETVRKYGVEDRVTIQERDIFELDLSPATVITLYLLPKLNVRLIPQLEQLKPGSRIVSHDFDMSGVEPERVLRIVSREDGVEHKIYLWKTPLKRVE